MERKDVFYTGFALGILGYIVIWMWLLGPWLQAEMRRIGGERCYNNGIPLRGGVP